MNIGSTSSSALPDRAQLSQREWSPPLEVATEGSAHTVERASVKRVKRVREMSHPPLGDRSAQMPSEKLGSLGADASGVRNEVQELIDSLGGDGMVQVLKFLKTTPTGLKSTLPLTA